MIQASQQMVTRMEKEKNIEGEKEKITVKEISRKEMNKEILKGESLLLKEDLTDDIPDQ